MFNAFFQHWLTHKHATRLIFLLGLLLTLPALFSGFFADDFVHLALINNGNNVIQPNNLSLFHLFSFIDDNPDRRLQLFGLGLTPWWISEQFTLIFFRPLSELTHYIDYRFFKPHAWLMHAHTLAWYALLLIVLHRFYQRFSTNTLSATLAFLFFAVDATHGFTIAWLANRNAIIAAVFCLSAVLFHDRFRHSAQRRYCILSLACIACSFLAGETGIAVGVFLLAYALFFDPHKCKKSILALMPALFIFISWICIYKSYGYGASGNRAYYIDPIESTALFLDNLPERLCQALAMQFNITPVHLYKPFGTFMTVMGSVYLLLLLVFALIKPNKTYLFFLVSLLLCIIPITSSELQDRNLLFVGIAACPILAQCCLALYERSRRLWASFLLSVVLFFHLFISALMMPPISYAPKLLAQSSINSALSLPPTIENKHIITVGAPLFDFVYNTAILYTFNKPLPQHFWNISTNPYQLSITQLDDRRYHLINPTGLLSGASFLLRNWQLDPVTIGHTFHLNQLDLSIMAVDASGTPTEAIATIDQTINVNDVQLFYWQNQQFHPLHLSIGETFLLP